MFYERSNDKTRSVAVFISFSANVLDSFKLSYVGVSPLEHGDIQSEQEHAAKIGYVIEIYRKRMEIVFGVIVNNCSTDMFLVDSTRCQFIGCKSTCYNLAIKEVMKTQELFIERIEKIMAKIFWVLAKLCNLTPYAPIECFDRRWLSGMAMISEYLEILSHFLKLESKILDDILLLPAYDKKVDILMAEMVTMDSIVVARQSGPLTTAHIRIYI